MKRITIDPVTRLEGHGRVEIFLDDDGAVANTYFVVPELRGFEQLCVGRPAEEMPRITNRICGLCPEAHHLASTKALDALFNVTPPPAATKVRELLYSAFFVTDHLTHFYILGGPDLLLGPDTAPAERNFLGVIRKLGKDFGKRIIDARTSNNEVIKMLGGRSVHPVAGLPGGWSQPLDEDMRRQIETVAHANIELASESLQLFEKVVLGNQELVALMVSEGFTDRTYSMGTVDQDNHPSFYDGVIRIVDPDGVELVRYRPEDYQMHIAEHVEPWTYLKLPYLKSIGWQGLSEGRTSGIYFATPLARLNAGDGMATPRAQESYERMYETLGSSKVNGRYQPLHHRLAIHWARLIEALAAAERMLELATDPEITERNLRSPIGAVTGEAVGSVEAPRGNLIHHYWSDENGILTRVNLIVGTTNNHAPIALSIKKAATQLIKKGTVVSSGLLNRIEMVLRAYDPCLSCATHTLGKMPLVVTIHSSDGTVVDRLSQ
jgi:F420-non-reducing hydrogenase large subunit